MDSIFDVIVIGGGAIGLSTAYHLSKENAKTLVLEQFAFGNQFGSSAGFSRQFRIPYPESYMVKLVKESIPFWDELQRHAKKPLLEKVGTLWFGDPDVHSTEGNIAEAEKALKEENIPFETLLAEDIEKNFPFRNLPKNYQGLFQADGASIDMKCTLETLFDQCHQSSCITLQDNTVVLNILPSGHGFEVKTQHKKFTCAKLVVVPGPYINTITSMLKFTIPVTYWNMSSAYFKNTDSSIKYPTWFVFQKPRGKDGNEFYGFPEVSWDFPGYVRVAPDFVLKPLDNPSQRTSIPNQQELDYTAEWVKNHMRGLEPTPHHTSTCFVALSNDASKELIVDFVPEFIPNNKHAVIYATGWAGKFIPLLGKILSDLTLHGKTSFDISNFGLKGAIPL
jgi:glycine/D-amino acid oxidase-like deaminating enzyme